MKTVELFKASPMLGGKKRCYARLKGTICIGSGRTFDEAIGNLIMAEGEVMEIEIVVREEGGGTVRKIKEGEKEI